MNALTQPCRPPWLIILLTLGLALGVTPLSAQDEALQWTFTEGDLFDVTLSQSTKIESKLDQRLKSVNHDLSLKLQWQVNSVDDEGTAKITQKLVGIKVSMVSLPTGADKPVDIDTAAPQGKKGVEAKLLKQLQPLVDSTCEVTMTRQGEVVDVEVPESTLETLRTAPGSMRLRNLLSKEGLKDLFGQSIVPLPKNPKLNDTWNVQSEISTDSGNLLRNHTYTWIDTQTDNNRMLAELKLETSVESAPTEPPPSVKLASFEGGGRLIFDMSNGYFASSFVTNEMRTEKPYREKVILTSVSSTVEMQVDKK